MKIDLKVSNGYKYVETKPESKEVLLLLHGLFGALSNFKGILSEFGNKVNIVVPMLPIYELPLRKTGLGGLVNYVVDFVNFKNFKDIHVLGNSLGGHIAQLYALREPDKIKSLILTGSSGLFESAMGNSFPKRGNYDYIKKKAESTFYDPAVATKELVDELFTIVNDRDKAIRIVATAKSAVRHNLADQIGNIKAPTLLVWGKQDDITPPFVAEKFKELIPNSSLVFIDKCGHAPMMEKPDDFNVALESFLKKIG